MPVADRFPGTPWGEEALLSLANHYQKDALDDGAAPWWRRLLAEYPDGRYAERAAWRVGWGDYRASRFEQAAQTFEGTARRRPPGTATPGLLYWSGRARLALGQDDRARELFRETIERYKNAYHGVRAQDALARMGGVATAPPALTRRAARTGAAVARAARQPGPPAAADRPARRGGERAAAAAGDAAGDGDRRLGRLAARAPSPGDHRHEARLPRVGGRGGRPAAAGGVAGALPHPLRPGAASRRPARTGLDPALVAALILQESSYDPGALSRAGARGLMQVMPATGRTIARAKGVRYKRAALHDPATSLDFGTHYLRQMSERYAGAVEKVLAAYNAGPHRVDAWTLARGEQPAEDFIETIPFTETRNYVMIVLANREQYRRLYGLTRTAPLPVVGGPQAVSFRLGDFRPQIDPKVLDARARHALGRARRRTSCGPCASPPGS